MSRFKNCINIALSTPYLINLSTPYLIALSTLKARIALNILNIRRMSKATNLPEASVEKRRGRM